MKKISFVLFLVMQMQISLAFAFNNEEKFSVVTYYPSPKAVFQELRAQRSIIGTNPGGFAADNNLIVEKRMGINTTFPASALQVNGAFKFVDGNQAEGKVLMLDKDGMAYWAQRQELSHYSASSYSIAPVNDVENTEKDMGVHIFCFLSGVLYDGSQQACQCSVNINSTSGTWCLQRTIKRLGGSNCGCEAFCLDESS